MDWFKVHTRAVPVVISNVLLIIANLKVVIGDLSENLSESETVPTF